MRYRFPAVIACSLLTTTCICVARADDHFVDHGVATRGMTRTYGATATVDGDGRRVVLVWLMAGGTGYVLAVDPETGAARQIEIPRPEDEDGEPRELYGNFSVLHSSRNRWYAHVGVAPWLTGGGILVEFDATTMSFTHVGATRGQYGMAFHEDGDGTVWAAIFPNVQLISYDPETRRLTDHGDLDPQDWNQYPRGGLARDRTGWLYTAYGYTRMQVVGYDPATGSRRSFIPAEERAQGSDSEGWHGGCGRVYLAQDGEVYAWSKGRGWHRMHGGQAIPLEGEARSASWDSLPVPAAPDRAGHWASLFREFPDGSRIPRDREVSGLVWETWGLNVRRRLLVVEETDGTVRRVSFDYDVPAPRIGNVTAGPDGAVYGFTHDSVFRFDPVGGTFAVTRQAQVNTWAVQGGQLFGAVYPRGNLTRFDATTEERTVLAQVSSIYRPHVLLAHPDGRHLVMGGTPDYGATGGSLLIYNLETEEAEILTHERLITNQSTVALAALPDGNLVGGTTVAAGTGGERLAERAVLYLLDWERREIVWHAPLEGGNLYAMKDLITGRDGRVYGLTSDGWLLVFDPAERRIVHRESLGDYGPLAPGGQGPRIMATGPDGRIHVLFRRAVVTLEPGSFAHRKLADSPVDIDTGIALLDGRLFFSSGANLWSFRLP